METILIQFKQNFQVNQTAMTFFVLSDNEPFALNQHLGGRLIKGAHVDKNINKQGKKPKENYLNDVIELVSKL